MNILSVASLLLAGVLTVRGEVFDCTKFNPNICTLDAILFCLTNGTMVTGRCNAQRAVCLDKVALDETFAACGHRRSDNFDCNAFNPMVCTRDAIPFCLHNGTIVRGTCLAKRAVCLENQSVDDDFSACNKAGSGTGGSARTYDGDGSAATTISATVPLLLALLTSNFLK